MALFRCGAGTSSDVKGVFVNAWISNTSCAGYAMDFVNDEGNYKTNQNNAVTTLTTSLATMTLMGTSASHNATLVPSVDCEVWTSTGSGLSKVGNITAGQNVFSVYSSLLPTSGSVKTVYLI